ncbi:MAG: IclR family transcriptional regulator [Acidimicrobiia bacterium]
MTTEGSSVLSKPATYLGRALYALELLAVGPSSPSQLAKPLGVNRSTTLRLLKELEDLGYVRRDPLSRNYDVVIERFIPILGAGRQAEWRAAAHQVLRDAQEQTGEATVLGMPAGPWMVYVDHMPSPHIVTVAERVGSVRPMHASALGKAWLSGLSDNIIQEVLESLDYSTGTEFAAHSPEALRWDVEKVRSRGWAVDQEEFAPGVVCIAVPVIVEGKSAAAIAISGPASRIGTGQIEQYASFLLKNAEKAGLSRSE